MENLNLLLEGFGNALTAQNLMFGLLGTFLGTLVGVLPGIGPALAIALLLPVTLSVDPTSALIMFAAVFYGAMYGGLDVPKQLRRQTCRKLRWIPTKRLIAIVA